VKVVCEPANGLKDFVSILGSFSSLFFKGRLKASFIADIYNNLENMTEKITDLNISIESNTLSDFAEKVSKTFGKIVRKNLDYFTEDITPEEYIIDCIKKSYHTTKLKQNIGTYSIKKNSKLEYCMFCIENITRKQHIRTLECGHVFHRKCVDRYLFDYNQNTCPCCRKEPLDIN
jgi:hypothetical protein